MIQARKWLIGLIALGMIAAAASWRIGCLRHRSQEEWKALETASALVGAIVAGGSTQVVSMVALPAGLASGTEQQQFDFILRALRDEVSIDGMAVMRREARFGRLADIFPEDAQAWSSNAGVRVEDCVAFRLEKNGLRSEIVIATNPARRVVRINDVRQMALPLPTDD